MARSIQITQGLDPNESNTDILSGKRFKFPEQTGLLKVVAIADGTAEMTVFVGGDNPLETSNISVGTGPPVEPDNIILMDADVFANQVIQVLVTDTSGVANEVRVRLALDTAVEMI